MLTLFQNLILVYTLCHMNIYILLFLALLLGGCKHSYTEYFTDNIKISSYEKTAQYELCGEKIIDGEIGLNDIEFIKDYLLLCLDDSEYKFTLYSVEGHKLLNFGTHGDGPNDFINNRLTGEKGIDSTGNLFVWINDVSMSKLKRIKISKSQNGLYCNTDKIIQTLPMAPNSFYVSDSLVISEILENGTYTLHEFNPITNSTNEEIILYEHIVKHPFNFYKGVSRYNKKDKKLIIGMHSINQVNQIDIENKERNSCLIGKVINENDIIDPLTGLENMTYYSDLRIGDNNIYALFLNQKYDDAYEVPKTIEIHVINGGEIKKIYHINDYVLQFAVDEKNNYLYGLIGDSAVYRYNMK